MIVHFSTRAGALTMHGDAAVALLKAMGHSGSVPGAILAGDLPGALASLRRHLEEQAHAPPSPPPQAEVPDEDDDRERAPPVTLHNDDAIHAIRLYNTAAADAIQEGKNRASGSVRADEFVEVHEDPGFAAPQALMVVRDHVRTVSVDLGQLRR